MKDLTRWFMGEDLGNVTINGWNWLWGMPPSGSPEAAKTSDDLILEDISRSLEEVRSIVIQIQHTVDRVKLETKEIQHQYRLQSRQRDVLKTMFLEFKRQGNVFEARSAMEKAIQLERVVSEWRKRLDVSHRTLRGIQLAHDQKSADLSLLEIDLKMIKTQRAVNNSIDLLRSSNLTIFQEKLQDIRAATEDRYQEIQIEIKLSHSSYCELDTSLNIDEANEYIQYLKNF
jgi:hypothetical protein